MTTIESQTGDSLSVAAFEAFAKAQAQFKSAVKDASNPFFKSKYADLASIWEAVKSGLAENGLMVTQPIRVTESGGIQVETIVRYKDGSIVETCLCPVICKVQNDPQAMGSAITYARRYSLASILCIVTDDDDANSATGEAAKPALATQAAPKTPNKLEQAQNAKALTEWQTGIDNLPNLASAYNDHRKLLAGLKGIPEGEVKDLFMRFRKAALEKGFDYDETKREFFVAEQVPA